MYTYYSIQYTVSPCTLLHVTVHCPCSVLQVGGITHKIEKGGAKVFISKFRRVYLVNSFFRRFYQVKNARKSERQYFAPSF